MESHSLLNDLDYIVIGIILLSGLLAMMRGFVRELFSLLAWAGAYFAAIKFFGPVVPWTHHYIKNDTVAGYAAMGVVFLVALIVLAILGNLVCGLIKGRVLTNIDRLLGFLYGVARGGLVISLLYLAAVMIFWPDIDSSSVEQSMDTDRNPPPEMLTKATTRPLMAYGANMLKVLVPKDMIDKSLKDIDSPKEGSGKSFREKAIDSITPESGSRGSVDINKLFNKDDKE